MPSGNIINIQGYEYIALDELLEVEQICENDIITGCKNVPIIWYIDYNEKKRRHFVDIFIPSQNRCIEVKSTWTAKVNNHTIFLKQIAAKELGYKYEIWVYDSNKIKVELYI
jgi:DNA repair protein RadC